MLSVVLFSDNWMLCLDRRSFDHGGCFSCQVYGSCSYARAWPKHKFSPKEREKEMQRSKVRPKTVFPSFMPHGPPAGEGEGATGTWAGQWHLPDSLAKSWFFEGSLLQSLGSMMRGKKTKMFLRIRLCIQVAKVNRVAKCVAFGGCLVFVLGYARPILKPKMGVHLGPYQKAKMNTPVWGMLRQCWAYVAPCWAIRGDWYSHI